MRIEAIRYALDVIQSDAKMTAQLREFIEIPFEDLKRAISLKVIKDEVVKKIELIAPTCYEIDGKIFLHGEEYPTTINGDEQTAIELYDMTTEMVDGESYTFYVSNIGFFKRASYKDTVAVKEFLDSLK